MQSTPHKSTPPIRDGVEVLDWVLALHVDLDAVNSAQLANLAATDGLTGENGIIDAPASKLVNKNGSDWFMR